MTDDPDNLQRFVEAQNPLYDEVKAELRSGRKKSHWMWFVFPQISGLGHSHTARHFAISSLAEAEAYLRHPILGPRLRECTALTLSLESDSAAELFGFPDFLKFRSSMTLFSRATSDSKLFVGALEKYFGGEPDSLTLQRLEAMATVLTQLAF